MSLLHGVGSGLGGAGDSGGALGSFYSHTLDQSLRFNDNDSAYLDRTLASDGNRKTWTLSFWIKRSNLGDYTGQEIPIFSAGTSGTSWAIFFTADDVLFIQSRNSSSNQFVQKTTEVFRDPSAWFHIVYAFDTTQATDTNRTKLYVNGEQLTLIQHTSNTLYPSQNTDYHVNNSSLTHFIGYGATHNEYLDGYLAEFNFIDGTAYDASYFGETKDGVWIPKEYSASRGSNGFYLPFSQDRTVGASAFFSDAGNSYVKFSNASYYDIGSSDDFTVEFFMWPTVKQLTENAYIFGYYGGTSGPYFSIQLVESSSNYIFYLYYGNGQAYSFTYSAGAVDAGRWHHVVVNRASGTLEMFLDGTRIGSTISSNTQSWDTTQVRIGHAGSDSSAVAYDGYLSNVRMVVGSAVYSAGASITVPTSTLTNVSNTKLLALTTTTLTADASSNNVTGTLHGSGYYATDGLSPFANGAFNEDAGSNGIDFSANNIFDYDVVLDSPTNNFPTMNSVYHSGAQGALSSGALKVSGGGFVNTAHGYGAVSTFTIPKDKKIYIEVECTDADGTYWSAGFATQSGLESGPSATTVGGSNSITVYNRQVYLNGTEIDYGGSAGLGGFGIAEMGVGEILGMAIDGATGKVWFSRNGTYFASPSTDNSGTTGDPAAGTNEIGTITGGTTEDVFVILQAHGTINNLFINFGQDSQNVASASADGEGIGTFEYAPPTGYVALCAANLTTPDIGPTQSSQADDFFDVLLWTGDGNTSRAITGLNFAPDWMWLKSRTHTEDHALEDTVRGVGKKLDSSGTEAEETTATAVLSAHGSDGFTLPASTPGNLNVNTRTYVAWNWKAGGKADTFNVDGTGFSSASDASLSGGDITPTGASINTTSGFSIISYTGNESADQTIKHGLSSAPEFTIIKCRDTNTNNNQWSLSSSHIGDDYFYFTTAAATGVASVFPTSGDDTTVTIGRTGHNVKNTNENNKDFIMYNFHSVEGYSKFGTYIGNGDADGPFVFTGFRPAFIISSCKVGGTGNWFMLDTTRSTFNEADDRLNADANSAESTGNADIDFLSNGFKLRTASTAGINQNTDTMFYFAFAEAPFKFANAR